MKEIERYSMLWQRGKGLLKTHVLSMLKGRMKKKKEMCTYIYIYLMLGGLPRGESCQNVFIDV